MAEKSRYNYRVEPQDVDFTLRATIPSLGGSILNTAGIDAHGKGFGVDALNADNHSWVLSRMAVEFDCCLAFCCACLRASGWAFAPIVSPASINNKNIFLIIISLFLNNKILHSLHFSTSQSPPWLQGGYG